MDTPCIEKFVSPILQGTRDDLQAIKDDLQDMKDGLQDIKDSCRNLQGTVAKIEERYLMEDIKAKYNQEEYAWYHFEATCDDWYMDSCHFWDDNYFHLLFDDSTPPYVEHIVESSQKPSMHTLLQSSDSPVLVDDFLVSSTYLDPHDQYQSWEHHFQLAIEF
jgi:hypothetical protein